MYCIWDTMNQREVGIEKEQLACEFLARHGICILERNFRTRTGEIDLIGRKDHTLIFFEVKYRESEKYGYPAQAVTRKKQMTICRVSDQYRIMHGEFAAYMAVRYDVIAILGNHISWIPDAFPYQGRGW